MTKKQNNDWMKRWKINKELQDWNLTIIDEKEILSFIQSEIDKAVEDKILEFKAIIDRNTVDGMYSPDGIAQDLITSIDNEAIKKHLTK